MLYLNMAPSHHLISTASESTTKSEATRCPSKQDNTHVMDGTIIPNDTAAMDIPASNCGCQHDEWAVKTLREKVSTGLHTLKQVAKARRLLPLRGPELYQALLTGGADMPPLDPKAILLKTDQGDAMFQELVRRGAFDAPGLQQQFRERYEIA